MSTRLLRSSSSSSSSRRQPPHLMSSHKKEDYYCPRVLISSSDVIRSPPPLTIIILDPCAFCGHKASSKKKVPSLQDKYQLDWLRNIFQMDEDAKKKMTFFCPSCHDSLTRLLRLREEMDDLVARMKAVLNLTRENDKNKRKAHHVKGPHDDEEEEDGFDSAFRMTCDEEDDDEGQTDIKPVIYHQHSEEATNNDDDDDDPLRLLDDDNPPDDDHGQLEEEAEEADEDEEWVPNDHREVTTSISSSKFFCLTCGRSYKDSWALRRHLEGRGGRGHFPNPALKIKKTKSQEEEMDNEKSEESSKSKYFCVTCGKRFKGVWHLERHTRRQGHTPNPHLRVRRLKRMSTNSNPSSATTKKEEGEEDETDTSAFLEAGMTDTTNGIQKEDNTMIFGTRTSSGKGVPITTSKFFCLTCTNCFKDSWHLRRHTERFGHAPNPHLAAMIKEGNGQKKKGVRGDKGPEVEDSKKRKEVEIMTHDDEEIIPLVPTTKFYCVTCGKSYKDSWHLQKHTGGNPGHTPNPNLVVKKRAQQRRTFNNTKLDPSKIAALQASSKTKYFCSSCGLTFKDRWNLDRHTARLGHTPNPSLEDERRGKMSWKFCRICNARFGSDLLHQAHTHPDPDDPSAVTYLCPTCGKGLKDRRELYNHLKFVHDRLRASQCDLCGKVFGTTGSMLAHVRTYHTSFEDQVTCPTCGGIFTSLRERVDHERVVHMGRPSHKCYFCPFIGRDRGGLTKHLRRHTLERPWICGRCGKETSGPHRLKGHLTNCKGKSDRKRQKKCS